MDNTNQCKHSDWCSRREPGIVSGLASRHEAGGTVGEWPWGRAGFRIDSFAVAEDADIMVLHRNTRERIITWGQDLFLVEELDDEPLSICSVTFTACLEQILPLRVNTYNNNRLIQELSNVSPYPSLCIIWRGLGKWSRIFWKPSKRVSTCGSL
jgi:hypothetical protein